MLFIQLQTAFSTEFFGSVMFLSPFKEETTPVLHYFVVPDCSIFSEHSPNFLFLSQKQIILKNWKEIMKMGPESFMFSYELSACVKMFCLCTPSTPRNEEGEHEGR